MSTREIRNIVHSKANEQMTRTAGMSSSSGVAVLDRLHEFQFVLGLLVMLVTIVYLYAMRGERRGISAVIAAMQLTDFLFGLASCASGARGLFISIYGSVATEVRPIKCALTAPHNHIWWVTDGVHAILLVLSAVDQLFSVLRSKSHSKTCQFYYRYSVFACMFLLSTATLAPALRQTFEYTNNATVVTGPFCFFNNVYDWRANWAQRQMRYWAPVTGLAILAITAFTILALQLKQQWQFKWSDDNDESTKLYFLIITRCTIFGACVSLPLQLFRVGNVVEPAVAEEINARFIQAILILTVSTPVHIMLLPRLKRRIASFFHLVDLRRNWQSAHDPPTAFESAEADSISWTSMAGNIVDDAGVPITAMDADEQRSISFFYERNPNL